MDQIQEETSPNTTEEVVEKLANVTNGPLLLGDVTTTVDILGQVVNVTEDAQRAPVENELRVGCLLNKVVASWTSFSIH